MINIQNSGEFDEVISRGVTLVDCYATWCGPCRMIAPFIEEIDSQYKDKIKVLKLDVDEYPEIASKYNVNAIPTLLFFKENELVTSNVGFMPKDDIVSIIDNVLSK